MRVIAPGVVGQRVELGHTIVGVVRAVVRAVVGVVRAVVSIEELAHVICRPHARRAHRALHRCVCQGRGEAARQAQSGQELGLRARDRPPKRSSHRRANTVLRGSDAGCMRTPVRLERDRAHEEVLVVRRGFTIWCVRGGRTLVAG